MAVTGKHGVSTTTPENILLGAGTIHKNLTWEGNAWKGDISGATSGGNSVEIKESQRSCSYAGRYSHNGSQFCRIVC